jgi:hypothetical protein
VWVFAAGGMNFTRGTGLRISLFPEEKCALN